MYRHIQTTRRDHGSVAGRMRCLHHPENPRIIPRAAKTGCKARCWPRSLQGFLGLQETSSKLEVIRRCSNFYVRTQLSLKALLCCELCGFFSVHFAHFWEVQYIIWPDMRASAEGGGGVGGGGFGHNAAEALISPNGILLLHWVEG